MAAWRVRPALLGGDMLRGRSSGSGRLNLRVAGVAAAVVVIAGGGLGLAWAMAGGTASHARAVVPPAVPLPTLPASRKNPASASNNTFAASSRLATMKVNATAAPTASHRVAESIDWPAV